MRPVVLSLCLIVATLLPKIGTAQVVYRPTPAPQTAVQSVPRTGDQHRHLRRVRRNAVGERRHGGDVLAGSVHPDRDYHGFPVYRETQRSANRIYVTVVADGPVAPYKRY